MIDNKKTKYSIVIPAYKRNNIVRQAILSVLNQKKVELDDIEIIIPDDEDDKNIRNKNEKFLKKVYKRIIYSVNKNEEGPGGNRQTGFDLANGEYITFLDSDDRLHPLFLTQMEQAMNHNSSIASTCLSKSVFESGFSVKEKVKLFPLILIRDISLLIGYLFNKKNVIPSSFYLCQISHMMFKRSVVKGQRFNYDYRRGGEDWDFFIQTMKKGSIAITPKKLLIFRYAKGSSTDNPVNRANKWKSYTLLRSRLTGEFKRWPYFHLFGEYIKIFGRGSGVKLSQ